MSPGEASEKLAEFITVHRSDRDETLAHKILEFLKRNPQILYAWGYIKKKSS